MFFKSVLWTLAIFVIKCIDAHDICSDVSVTRVFTEYKSKDKSYVYNCNQPDLRPLGSDNSICSSNQTGFWLYYENDHYNTQKSGSILWIHGIDYFINFPVNNCATTTSLRFAGNRNLLNENSYTLYDGTSFTGDDFYGTKDLTDFAFFNNRTSSLILTGLRPWTFYRDIDYKGSAFCYHSNTTTDESKDGTTFVNYGIYPTLTDNGIEDNCFQSVRQGCFITPSIINTKTLQTNFKPRKDTSGSIDPYILSIL